MKKFSRFFALLVLVAMCITLLPVQAASESDLTFSARKDGQGYYVFKCNGSASGSLVIPSSYNGKPVTHIRLQAFQYCSSLTSITLPDTMVYAEEFAFYGCSSLSSIHIPEGMNGMGKGAFKDCKSLTSVTIPSTMDRITPSMFYGCSKLKTVNLPDGLAHIDSTAFQYCYSLTNLTLPDTVCNIGTWAFNGCSSLRSLVIPSKVKTLQQYSFSSCSSLTTVAIPASVTKIEHHAFDGCVSLSTVIYCGTEDQWNEISIDGYNEKLLQANRKYHDWVGTGSQKACTVCGITGDGHEHIWKDATCTTPKTCAVCGLTEGSVAEHSYNAGVVTKPATCKEEGSKTCTCTVCNATKVEKISKLTTHTYDNACDTVCNVCSQTRTVSHNYQAAWSSDETYHWHACSVCANKTDTTIHSPGPAATETTPQSCTVCGYVIAPALGAQTTQPTVPVPTEPDTQPATPPATVPETQPATPPDTQPDSTPTVPPETQPETPDTQGQDTPKEPANDSGISALQLVLIMLAEAAILCTVFFFLWKKKR